MKPSHNTMLPMAGLVIILAISMSACSTPAATSPSTDVGVYYTQAAATIALGLTQTQQAAASLTHPAPTASPRPISSSTSSPPTETPASAATPSPIPLPVLPSATTLTVDPASAHGCYNASFVEDVTILYSQEFSPGERFTKVWRVKNTGSCDWPRGFKIAFISGNRLGADTIVIDQKVIAGDIADISLDMIAPNMNGVVNSNWRLATDIDKPFGPLLSVTISLPVSLSISATVSSSGCLNSALIEDVSIPTGTLIQPNAAFTKTWRIKNTGTCTWNREFQIAFVGGEMLGADTSRIRQVVEPGVSAEISINMIAPGSTGTFSTAWQLASDSGTLFGQLFAFVIAVK